MWHKAGGGSTPSQAIAKYYYCRLLKHENKSIKGFAVEQATKVRHKYVKSKSVNFCDNFYSILLLAMN